MIIEVQLKNASVEVHECAHFEVKDNGVLYIYDYYERHEFGATYTVDTAYSRDFWQCVTKGKKV